MTWSATTATETRKFASTKALTTWIATQGGAEVLVSNPKAKSPFPRRWVNGEALDIR